jgi:hypothetical protein
MTKQVMKLADSIACRRGFLAQVAKLGAVLAAGLVCVLDAKPASARGSPKMCYYGCPDGSYIVKKAGKKGCKDAIKSKGGGWCVHEEEV